MGRLVPESMVIEHKITFEKIKTHVREKKASYISGAAGIGIGAVAVFVLRKPQIISIAPAFNNMPVISPVFNNNNIANFGGYTTKITQRLSDGKIWQSATEAAYEIAEKHNIPVDHARVMLSRNTNEHIPHVFGEQYRTIGFSTVD